MNMLKKILPCGVLGFLLLASCKKDDVRQANGSVQTDTADTLNTPNVSPVAIAGPDTTIELPWALYKPFNLDGSASFDPDGSIVSFEWKKISGPVFYCLDKMKAIAPLGCLSPGVYVFSPKII